MYNIFNNLEHKNRLNLATWVCIAIQFGANFHLLL